MKALLSEVPGGPETLRLTELADPVAGRGELLVRVRAAVSGLRRLRLARRSARG